MVRRTLLRTLSEQQEFCHYMQQKTKEHFRHSMPPALHQPSTHIRPTFKYLMMSFVDEVDPVWNLLQASKKL